MVEHLDRCLGCMACVTACPSGVQYDKLIEDTRAQVERNSTAAARRPRLPRLLFELFPHPGAAARAGAADRPRAPARHLARGPAAAAALPRLAALAALAPPDAAAQRPRARLPERDASAAGERAAAWRLLQGCVQRVFFNDVNAATVAVLARRGIRGARAAAAALLRRAAAAHRRGLERAALAKATIAGVRAVRPRGGQRRRLRLLDEGLRTRAARRSRLGRARRGASPRRCST